MEPRIKHGSIVFISLYSKRFAPGDIVVATVSEQLVIKSVKKIHKSKIELVGLHTTTSQDSSSYGPIDIKQILGKVIYWLPK